MLSNPTDHLPKTVRDRDCIRRDEEIERRKVLYRQARNVSAALRTVTDRQRGGQLTRADGAVLAQMILQNVRACVRKEHHYRPTRARVASLTGYSERTVSKSITRLKEAGLIVAQRYAKGGRLGNKGKGLATEFRSGCLQFLCDQMASLGYRLGKDLRSDITDLGNWAAVQVGQHTEIKADAPRKPKPTGNLVRGTVMYLDRAAPKSQTEAPVARTVKAKPAVDRHPPTGSPRPSPILSNEHATTSGSVGLKRPALGRLSRMAVANGSQMVPMPRLASVGGTDDPTVLFSLPKNSGRGC